MIRVDQAIGTRGALLINHRDQPASRTRPASP